ncbi:exodeoxyribonuclease V subunit alpha [Saccharospirillum sp. HFRX-1]|uniref:exodeoxyribonuclease V subunit alpha n=1 Tax=unclassified Saccharospirillum TaxID=2633430 RepID=UPI003713B94E
MSELLDLNRHLEGVAELDLLLAERLCEFLNCQDDWLFHSLVGVSQALQQGHACLQLSHWAGRFEWRAEDDPDSGYRFPALEEWIEKLSALPIGPDDNAPVVFDLDRLYLRRYWRFETKLAAALGSRLNAPVDANLKTAKQVLTDLFGSSDTTNWQQIAAANALLNRFTVIAGGPGTGKTFTVTRLLALLAATATDLPVIKLAAPTGKAAQRLGESIRAAKAGLLGPVDMLTLDAIPETASTLHRLLGVIPNQLDFRHNDRNLLELDILVVDEVSMVDLPLMTRLFRALPEHARVIFLGDADQLPSVAAGSVLADLAERPHPGYSKARKTQLKQLGIGLENGSSGSADYLSYLYDSRRFGPNSGIGQLAREVIDGQSDASLATLKGEHSDVQWLGDNNLYAQIDAWTRTWYQPIAQAENLSEAFDRLFQFRLLCPTRVGPRGVEALNERIERQLNPNREPAYRGQPIMITENHYGVGLYNGDIGLLWPDDNGQLLAWFPEGESHRPVAPGRLPRHETVYAMTIHKTQGSEFERVALVLPETPSAMLTRELIYTGLTRAKQELVVFGGEGVWLEGVRMRVERHSGLKERLLRSNYK